MNNETTLQKARNILAILEPIPEEEWCTGSAGWNGGQGFDGIRQGAKCVLGHLGERLLHGGAGITQTKLSREYKKLLWQITAGPFIGCEINDGAFQFRHFGHTPKSRVINSLKYLIQRLES